MLFNQKLILDYMQENNLSKTKFCKLSGIAVSALNKLLNNDLKVHSIALVKLALFLNVSTTELIYNKQK